MSKASIEALLTLAKEGAHPGPLKLSLAWLARKFGTSRQTASRRLAELERARLIQRELKPRGQSIRLTPAGLATLRSLHRDLGAILGKRAKVLELRGQVTSGLGEGSYYMRQEGYRRQFKRELGFDPYPGTLDLKLDRPSLELKEVLQGLPGIPIKGFTTPERTFGPVKCFPAKLQGVKAAVILPSRTHHSDVLEVIAPRNLRRSLGLRDGDLLRVEVEA